MFRCFFDIIDSTNTEAKRVINNNSALPDVFSIVSIHQTQARGKLGSTWKTSAGNLNLSIILNLTRYLDDIKNIGLMSILSSVALRETINYFLEKDSFKLNKNIEIKTDSQVSQNIQNSPNVKEISPKVISKWPNDLLIKTNEKIYKIAGILLEIEQNSKGENYLIIGMGVNLVWSPKIDKYSTISLFEITNQKIDILDFIDILEKNIFELLEELQSNKEVIISKFKENLFLFNEYIQIKVGDSLKSGIFSDITKEGFLILNDKGNKITVTAGEIFGF